MKWISEIEKATRSDLRSALCTIVSVRGSAPRSAGARMIVYEDGSIRGTIGGGNLEKKVMEQAFQQIRKESPALFRHDLLYQLGMCCGGTVEVFIEPIERIKRLYIFGAGHTGIALANLAAGYDFETFVMDDRDEYIRNIEIEGVDKLCGHHAQLLPSLPFNERTYIMIMTYDHAFDRDILGYCIRQPHAYLGMIGSKRKVTVTRKMFLAAGIAAVEELDRVDMPAGVNIGAQTPEEIALSIMAKLIQTAKIGKMSTSNKFDRSDINIKTDNNSDLINQE
jgi:xanthine dehydrogenase accessory factor